MTSRGRLQALWAMYVTDGTSVPFLREQLQHEDEHVRAWAIRLLVDRKQPLNVAALERQASREASAFVRLHLASALGRLPVRSRWGVAKSLVQHAEDEADHNLPHLIWYGVAALWEDDQPRYLNLLQSCRIPMVRQHMARRVATAGGLPRLVQLLPSLRDVSAQIDVLTAIERTVRGAKLREITAWTAAYEALSKSSSAEVRRTASSVGLALGDARAKEYFQATLMDAGAPIVHRQKVLQALVDNQVDGVATLLHRLLAEPEMRLAALRGLGSYRDPETPAKVLAGYNKLSALEKQAALDTLASRATFARQLLDAIEAGSVPSSDVTAFTARQIRNLGSKQITARLRNIWGEVRTTSNQKRKALAKFKRMLSGEGMQGADRSNGRVVYNNTCLKCHKLFGEGGKIGPDLTGSNRHNLDYILENVVDPSAVVARDFQMIIVETEKGRVVTGLVVSKTDEQLVLQAADRRIVLAALDVARVRVSPNSMMPEGQLDKLDDKAIRDLVAYLASPMQVKLPAGVEQPKIDE